MSLVAYAPSLEGKSHSSKSRGHRLVVQSALQGRLETPRDAARFSPPSSSVGRARLGGAVLLQFFIKRNRHNRVRTIRRKLPPHARELPLDRAPLVLRGGEPAGEVVPADEAVLGEVQEALAGARASASVPRPCPRAPGRRSPRSPQTRASASGTAAPWAGGRGPRARPLKPRPSVPGRNSWTWAARADGLSATPYFCSGARDVVSTSMRWAGGRVGTPTRQARTIQDAASGLRRTPLPRTWVNSLLGTRLDAFPLHSIEYPLRLKPSLVELNRRCKNSNSHRLSVDLLKDDEPDLVVLA
jgi:hypothetical protein